MSSTQTDKPKWWSFDDDGDRLDGLFVSMGQGHTQYGPRPFVVLQLDDGSERTLWLHNSVLLNAFRREVHARPSKQLDVGEYIGVQRLGTKESENGRDYVDFDVTFEHTPELTQADILGAPPESFGETVDDEAAPDDGIPF